MIQVGTKWMIMAITKKRITGNNANRLLKKSLSSGWACRGKDSVVLRDVDSCR
jgi:hypothetical protein